MTLGFFKTKTKDKTCDNYQSYQNSYYKYSIGDIITNGKRRYKIINGPRELSGYLGNRAAKVGLNCREYQLKSMNPGENNELFWLNIPEHYHKV